MNANGLGLFNSLATIINSEKRDSDYAIASYIVSRIDDLSSISITDIMSEAFVTRSAVRRFCNRVGFDSFSDIKTSVTEAAYPSDLNHRDFHVDVPAYRADLDKGIMALFTEMKDAVDDDAVEELCESVYRHDPVILACASNTSGVLGRFQQELFCARKVVRLVTDTFGPRLSDIARDSDALVIVVSASGVFARALQDDLADVTAQKYLVTAMASKLDESLYDRVYRLTRASIAYDRLGLYGKYGVSYFFDLLSASYLHAYA